MKLHTDKVKEINSRKNNLLNKYCDSAIVLCGGKGSRLGSVGLNLPKCLLKVGKKTLLEHHISTLENIGIKNIYLVTGYLSKKVVAFVDALNVRSAIHFVVANDLGTGGSINCAAKLLSGDKKYYFVAMADVMCLPDLFAMLDKSLMTNAKINILGAKVNNSKEYGIIIHDNNGLISEFREKVTAKGLSTIDAGYYLFDRDVLKDKSYPEKFSIEYDIFPYVKNMYVTEHSGSWVDVGTIPRLNKARKMFLKL